jgi:zinc-ribbon domain
MFCVNCGREIANGVKFCDACGTAASFQAPLATPFAHGANPVRIDAPIWLFCIIGGILGGIIGYLTRPSAFLVGQLPFGTVVTGGAGLQGLDQLLVPIARQSFNQMLIGTIVGALLGGIAGAVLRRLKATSS